MVPDANAKLLSEVNKIISNASNLTTNVYYDLYLQTVDIDIPIKFLDTIEILRDYNGNIGDYGVLNFMLESGTYMKYIHNNRDNLEVTIIKHINSKKIINRYKFVIYNTVNDVIGTHLTTMTTDDLNKSSALKLEGQFLNRTLEVLRGHTVDGIYTNNSSEDILKHIFIDSTERLKVESENLKLSVSMIPADNKRVIKRLTIPTGTKLFDLPPYLQDVKYGVYNGGIGVYLQQYGEEYADRIFLYPLYDNRQFDRVEKKVIIFNIHNNMYDHIEKTYFIDGDIIKLFSTSDSKTLDTSENEIIDSGNAIIKANTQQLFTKSNSSVLVTDDNIGIAKKLNLQGKQNYNRADGVNVVKFIKDNESEYKYKADAIRKDMMFHQLQWNYSNIDLLYPGMPVMYVYIDNEGKIVKLTGTLQSVYVRYNKAANKEAAILNIAVEKPHIKLRKES